MRGQPIAEISVPVKSLRGESSGMDHDMHSALKAEAHPAITYTFQKLLNATVQRDGPGHQASLKLRIMGTLDMAGVSKPISMDVIVKRNSPRHFVAYARTQMLMSEFAIKPPVALLGLIRADDKVNVVFDLDLVMRNKQPQPIQYGDARH